MSASPAIHDGLVRAGITPPKKLALGERAVMADGGEYVLLELKEAGRPVEPVYATEGTPLIVGPNGIFKQAPNPNAARLFQSFCFTPEAQQLIIDHGGMRSEHLQTKEKTGRKPFREIKVMKEDAVSVERMSEEIKARYTKIFGV
jgi:iron(III) transport system substrate-binding protein